MGSVTRGSLRAISILGLSFLLVAPSLLRAPDAPEPPSWPLPPHLLEFSGSMRLLLPRDTDFQATVAIHLEQDGRQRELGNGALLISGEKTFVHHETPAPAGTRSRLKVAPIEIEVLSLPASNATWVIIESFSAYVRLPFKPSSTNNTRVVETDHGPSRVGIYDCRRREVTLLHEGCPAERFVVDAATKLRGFPVQVQRVVETGRVVFTFSGIRFSKPADALFLPDTEGCRRYERLSDVSAEMIRRVGDTTRGRVPAYTEEQRSYPTSFPTPDFYSSYYMQQMLQDEANRQMREWSRQLPR